MKVERMIRSLPESYFCEVVKRIPSIQQDAYKTIYYLGGGFSDVVGVCGRDVTDRGIRMGGQFFKWPEWGKESEALRARLAKMAAESRPDERIFESQKSKIKASWDLRVGFRNGIEGWQHYRELKGKNISASLPKFLVLGAPRCATTWLYKCLASHPEVFVPHEKELEFFGNYRYYLGLNWYKRHFVDWVEEKIGGDVSVGYFTSAEAPSQIRQHLDASSTKFIVLLREPVGRALSYYEHRLLSGNAPSSFEKSLNMRYFRNLYIETGHYYRYLENYLRYFSRDQFLLLLFEEIQREPQLALQKVFEFLEVQKNYLPENYDTKLNVGRSVKSANFHYLVYKIGFLFQVMLPYKGIGNRLRRITDGLDRRVNLKCRSKIPCLNESVYKNLRSEFRESNMRLEKLAGINLAIWEDERKIEFV